MKKRSLYLRLLFAFIISVYLMNCIASEELAASNPNITLANNTINPNILSQNTNSILEKQISIPENLQIPARILFGLQQSENIEFSVFIVLIAIWIFFFALLKIILEVVPFFGDGWKSWAGGIVITCLIAITGAIKTSAEFLFGFGNFFKNQSLLRLILTIILLAIIGYGSAKLLGILKNQTRKASAYQAGMNTSVP